MADLGMLEEVRIEWGPGAAIHKPNTEISLDLDCILVPKRIWPSWPSPLQRTRRANNYLRRLAIPGSQPFARTQQDWNWKNQLAPWMNSGEPMQAVESIWNILPSLAVWGLIQGDATTLYIYLGFLWEGHLNGPLRVQSLMKVPVRRGLATLLEANLLEFSLNTISGLMGPDRPLRNFGWEASKLLSLVQTLQLSVQLKPILLYSTGLINNNNQTLPPRTGLLGRPLPVPNHGQGPPALDRGQLSVRHASTDTRISTTSTITFTSRVAAQELTDRLRPGAVHTEMEPAVRGKILKPDVLIPAHL